MIAGMCADFTRSHGNCLPTAAPRLVIGTWALAGDGPWGYGPCSGDLALETLIAALEAGCSHFDTAAMFGDGAVERLLGRVLGALPAGHPEVTITTRVGVVMAHGHPAADFSPAALQRGLEASTERLGRVPDTVLLHTPAIGVLQNGAALRWLLEAVKTGLCGAAGASVFDPEEALVALESGARVLCLPYNLANRRFEAVMQAARLRGVAVRVREVLHNGRLTTSPSAPHGWSRHDVRRGWPPALLERIDKILRPRIAALAAGGDITATSIGYALGHPVGPWVVVGCRGAEQVRRALAAKPLDAAARLALESTLYNPDSPSGVLP